MSSSVHKTRDSTARLYHALPNTSSYHSPVAFTFEILSEQPQNKEGRAVMQCPFDRWVNGGTKS